MVVEGFELSPLAIRSIYLYWKRILPLELLYVEAGAIRLHFDLFKLRLKLTFVDTTVCLRMSHQAEWNSDINWAREVSIGYKHRLANAFIGIVYNEISSQPSVSFFETKLDELAQQLQVTCLPRPTQVTRILPLN